MTHEHQVEHPSPNPPGEHPGSEVTITINGVAKHIHRGHHNVVELKDLGGIPHADELAEIIDRKLVPLPDDGAVRIKGGEEFVSHPRTGGSSC